MKNKEVFCLKASKESGLSLGTSLFHSLCYMRTLITTLTNKQLIHYSSQEPFKCYHIFSYVCQAQATKQRTMAKEIKDCIQWYHLWFCSTMGQQIVTESYNWKCWNSERLSCYSCNWQDLSPIACRACYLGCNWQRNGSNYYSEVEVWPYHWSLIRYYYIKCRIESWSLHELHYGFIATIISSSWYQRVFLYTINWY